MTKRDDREFKHRPFKGLKGVRVAPPAEPVPEPEEIPEPSPAENGAEDEAAYRRAMSGVSPLEDDRQLAEKEARPRVPLAEIDEDELVMKRLDDLVQGEIPFDFADTHEHIEAHAAGLDRRLVRKLRRGEYSLQAHLDLHGMYRDEARDAVAAFIRKCYREDKRCVLIVHGRGLGSKEGIPVLKNKLAAWLTRGSIGRKVLAYVSARPYDGGVGAVYVLLRS